MDEKTAQPHLANPYIGPIPFREEHKLYGRKDDTQAIADLLISKRIVLLIAPSGAGKTSLIQAELVPQLRSRLNPLPIIRLDRVPDCRNPKNNRYVHSALCSLETRFPKTEQLSEAELTNFTLASYCASRVDSENPDGSTRFPLLILDQFEELFTLDRFDWDKKKEFIEQLAIMLGAPSGSEVDRGNCEGKSPLTIWALLSMREDHIAELEPYLDLIPTGLAFRYRMERLEREQAIEAITGPAGNCFAADAAERLVNDLRKLRSFAADGEERWQLGRFVEPVQLQVVCRRLWDKVGVTAERPITLMDVATGEQSSEVDPALAEYFDLEVERATNAAGVKQRDLRDWVEAKLITRTKVRTKALREPASLGKIDEALQSLVESHLLSTDIAGEREWYELSHDRLINPILKSNETWRDHHLALVQKVARLWAEEPDRPENLLFSGEQLNEAQRFVDEHPDETGKDEIAFLKASKLQRERIDKEKKQQDALEKINEKLQEQQGELKQKNRSLKLLLKLSVLISILAAGFITFSGLTVSELKKIKAQKIVADTALSDSRFLEALTLSRAGDGHRAIERMVKLTRGNEESGLRVNRVAVDMKFIEILGRYPPVETAVGQHGHIVRTLKFSSDGKFLYSGGWDNKLKVWALAAPNAEKLVYDNHGSNIYSLAYHGEKGLLASTDADGLIQLWRVGEVLQKGETLNSDHSAHTGRVTSAAFSPDGKYLATASYWDKRIVIWDVSNFSEAVKIKSFGKNYHSAPIYRVAFVERGTYAGSLVSADLDGKIWIWGPICAGCAANPKRELNVEKIIGKRVGLFAMAVSPSGRWVAGGDSEGNVLVWDLDAAETTAGVRLLPNLSHWDMVTDMTFSQDSTRLVTVGSDEALLDWRFPPKLNDVSELEKKVRVTRLEGWGDKLYSVAFHPSREGVVAIGQRKNVVIADINKLNPLATPIDGAMGMKWLMLAATSDLGSLAGLELDRKTIHVWRRDTTGYRPVDGLYPAFDKLARIALSPDGKELATLSCAGGLVIRSTEAGGAQETLKEALQTSRCDEVVGFGLAFSPNGRMLTIAHGPSLYLWSRTTSGDWQEFDLDRFDMPVRAVAFSPKSDMLAAAGDFGRIRTWVIDGGRPSKFSKDSADAAQEQVVALVFNPNNRNLVSGGDDASVWEWDVPTLAKVGEHQQHKRAITSLVFGVREGTPMLASSDREGLLVLCSEGVSDDKCVRIGSRQRSEIKGLAVDSGFEHLVVAGDGLWVWDLRHKEMQAVATRLAARVTD